MKKTEKMASNLRLKGERELHGWSQRYVADQIGAQEYYLSRWERGAASPSPYYRHKLCILFAKNAEELGLIPQKRLAQESNAAAIQPVEVAQAQNVPAPAEPLLDPAIPLPVADVTGLVGRDDLLRQLKQRLRVDRGTVLTALNGLPGVGKTTLVVELVHDSEVRAYFPDGVLWAGLGPRPNVLDLLSRWGALLRVAPAGKAELASIESWTKTLRAAIGVRRILIVIDDVWEIEAALAFKIGGSNCSYLLTTRFPIIAAQFALEGAISVQELTEHDSITLLARLVPKAVTQETLAAYALVQAVGGLPLALGLIGRYLRTQAYSGQPRRLHAAMRRLQDAEARLQLAEPQALLERSPQLRENTTVSLQTIIGLSDQQLNEREQQTLRSLAAFPARPNSFSEEAALFVSQASFELLDSLTDAGLVEGCGSDRYTLHQTIADYARTHLTNATPYQRLAEYFADYVSAHEKDYKALEQETSNVFAALDATTARGLSDQLIRCANAWTPFLEARGLYAQAEAYLQRAENAARVSGDQPALVTVLLNLGEVTSQRGNYVQSETYLLEGLTLARQACAGEGVCRLLTALGVVAVRRGNYAQAEAFFQEALDIARLDGDSAATSDLLRHLGGIAGEQGRYTQAEACMQEGLTLARQTGDPERISNLLINLGLLEGDQGNYAQAQMHLQEALHSARQIGHRERISNILANLGWIAGLQGSYAQAEGYLQEGLMVARQIDHPEAISNVLLNVGWIAGMQHHFDFARTALLEALDLARAIGYRERISNLLTNLGWISGLQKSYMEAEGYLREGLTLARELGHHERVTVTLLNLGWIAGLQKHYTEAEAYLQEGLSLARQIQHPERMSGLLLHLGIIASAQNHYAQAEAYLQEGIALARKIGNSWFLAQLYYAQGELLLKQGHIEAAAPLFEELFAQSSEQEQEQEQEAKGLALYGLAQVAAARGQQRQASRQARESLAIFTAMGHQKTQEIQQWLATQPTA